MLWARRSMWCDLGWCLMAPVLREFVISDPANWERRAELVLRRAQTKRVARRSRCERSNDPRWCA
jgi:hypothetical protein